MSASEAGVYTADVSGQQQNTGLTEAEAEVYRLLTVEKLWPAAIARRRKCSRSAVSNVLSSLRKKGFINKVNNTHINNRCTVSPLVHFGPSLPVEKPIRLHGEEWKVKILRGGKKYDQARQRSSSLLVMGNRVVLYRDLLMVFSYESFEGDTPDDCERIAGPYWVRFFTRLESDLGVMILKERSQNIIRVKAHYAEMGNELADDLRRKKEKLRVFSSVDGKEWMLFDDSNRGNEAETTHSVTARDGRTAHEDMAQVVQPFFNDLRDTYAKAGVLLTPSEVYKLAATALDLHAKSMQLHQDTAAGMQAIVKALQLQQKPKIEGAADEPKVRPWYVG